ncbi:hypothetical protein [Roseateles asaccharophilus]|uniref:Uncharacterized protein n=1 Tax=Roseateles asaccharophilus TaxID=582607 RepID=A0ABU2ABI2_9BURK|nr:hypothetical protein [Roseateles asaccharophilus]MDR7334562.1 hypothetical protein [Roseateles asaccharophilus]
MSDETRTRHFVPAATETELGTKAAEGAGIAAPSAQLADHPPAALDFNPVTRSKRPLVLAATSTLN